MPRRRRPDLDAFMKEHGLTDMDGFLGKRPMTTVEMSLAREGMISEFFDAARDGNVERVQRLLETEYRIAMVRATTPNGATAFSLACEKVHTVCCLLHVALVGCRVSGAGRAPALSAPCPRHTCQQQGTHAVVGPRRTRRLL